MSEECGPGHPGVAPPATCQRSSTVEQRYRKPSVEGSIPPVGSRPWQAGQCFPTPGSQITKRSERETGLEPATFCLGSRHSTAELLPHSVEKLHYILHFICRPQSIQSLFPASVGRLFH